MVPQEKEPLPETVRTLPDMIAAFKRAGEAAGDPPKTPQEEPDAGVVNACKMEETEQ